MSSSKKKQLRKEQYMTERQASAAAEAKKLKCYTLTFWVVIALVVCIFIGAVASTPIKNVLYKNADAVTVGDHTLSAVELNYFYIDAVNNYYSTYSSYISYILDTTKPLDEQYVNSSTGLTWADSFVQSAESNIQSTYALYDLAVKNGHEMTASEQSSLESTMSTMKLYATLYGYSDLTSYLRAVYGNGATEESYRNYLEVSALASSYYTAYSESLDFTADELAAYEAKAPYTYSAYNYSYYYLGYSTLTSYGTTDEDGKTTFTDEQKVAAAAAAKELADDLAAGNYETVDEFNDAIAEMDKSVKDSETSTATSTTVDSAAYSEVSSLYRDWMVGKQLKDGAEEKDEYEDSDYEYITRNEGDIKVFEYATGSGDSKTVLGYYIVRFESVSQNDYALKNVRHILIACSGTAQDDGSIEFSDEEAAATAKAKAESILAEFLAGDATESSFETLGNKYVEGETASEAALYEDISPDTNFVDNFKNWALDDNRQVGDCEIVETEYGYHIMYFAGFSDTTYRDYLIETALQSETLTNWYTEVTEAVTVELLTDKYVNKSITLG